MRTQQTTSLIIGSLLVAAVTACQTTPASPPTTTAPMALPTHYNPTAPAATGPLTAPAFTGSGNGVLSAEMLAALRQLSADDYQTRQDAVQKLQLAMTRHFQQLVQMQELMLKIQDNLSSQLQQLTGTPPAAKDTRAASLMEFNQALSRWAIDTLNQPPARREAQLQWGLSPQGYPLVVRAYASKAEIRAAVAKDLAKVEAAPAGTLLEMLLEDPDREVSLTAMDAIWDKPLSPQNLDLLWNKAIFFALQQTRPQPNRQQTVVVHGRAIMIYDRGQQQNPAEDSDIAADLLIHTKSPQVTARLNSFFQELNAKAKNPNDFSSRILSPNYGMAGQTLGKMVAAFKPKEAFPIIILMMTNTNQRDGYLNNMNNINYWMSSRVDAAGLLLKVANQNPEDFKIRKIPNFGDRWVFQCSAKAGDQEGAMKEEQQVIRKVLVWWQDHYKEFDAQQPPKLPPEEDPKAPPLVPPGGVPGLGGMPPGGAVRGGIRVNFGPGRAAAVVVNADGPTTTAPATTQTTTQPKTQPATAPAQRPATAPWTH